MPADLRINKIPAMFKKTEVPYSIRVSYQIVHCPKTRHRKELTASQQTVVTLTHLCSNFSPTVIETYVGPSMNRNAIEHMLQSTVAMY